MASVRPSSYRFTKCKALEKPESHSVIASCANHEPPIRRNADALEGSFFFNPLTAE